MKNSIIIFVLVFAFINVKALGQVHEGDSLVAIHSATLPIIDGDSSDVAWNELPWYSINYAWKPYAETIASDDFSGRFKITWNKETNLLYFLVDITDNKWVNGYVYNKNDGSYPLFDVLEVFIDEDRPGGEHGCNNTAFAYHITGGNENTDFDALDIFDPTDSYNWGSGIYVNSKEHIPEFQRSNIGTKYIWEFSLMVLKSTYTPDNDPELFKTTLLNEKKMGLTLAYCDNDNSAIDPKRDHFVASKYQTEANNDISWQNSTYFGSLILKDAELPNAVETIPQALPIKIWMNRQSNMLNYQLIDDLSPSILQIVDVSGCILLEKKISQSGNTIHTEDLSFLKKGLYFAVCKQKNRIHTLKIIK